MSTRTTISSNYLSQRILEKCGKKIRVYVNEIGGIMIPCDSLKTAKAVQQILEEEKHIEAVSREPTVYAHDSSVRGLNKTKDFNHDR